MPVLLVALVGLPAAGKTSLSRRLCEAFDNSATLHVEAVHFDDFEASAVTFDPQEWKDARTAALSAVTERLDALKAESNKCNVLLVDDNGYYRSMRKQLFHRALETGAAFAQVYLRIDVESALRRNAARDAIVPEQSLRRMASLLEPPLPQASLSEKHCLQLESLDIDLDSDALMETVRQFFTSALANPVEGWSGEAEAAAEEARRANAESLLHQIDLASKKVFGDMMRAAAEASDAKAVKREFGARSRDLNALRREFKQQIQQGTRELWAHLDSEAEEDGCTTVSTATKNLTEAGRCALTAASVRDLLRYYLEQGPRLDLSDEAKRVLEAVLIRRLESYN